MNKTVLWTALWIGLLAGPVAPAQELGYRRITMKKRIQEFYRTGGKGYVGAKVHIYVDAALFRAEPMKIVRPGGTVWLLFKNRSVPILVNPINPYYKRFLGKMKKKGKKIKTVSLYGRVIEPSWDVKGRCHIHLLKMKTYGGALVKSGG